MLVATPYFKLARGFRVPDKYILLTQKFPLKPIENVADLDRALEISAELMDNENNLDADEKRYLEAILQLIQLYEDSNYTDIEDPPSTPQEMLRSLLEVNNMSKGDLANLLMIDTKTTGDLIEGTQQLSAEQISILSARFNVASSLLTSRDADKA
jgi:antitoxin component HigA of HigAB toxin-antitoxin module